MVRSRGPRPTAQQLARGCRTRWSTRCRRWSASWRGEEAADFSREALPGEMRSPRRCNWGGARGPGPEHRCFLSRRESLLLSVLILKALNRFFARMLQSLIACSSVTALVPSEVSLPCPSWTVFRPLKTQCCPAWKKSLLYQVSMFLSALSIIDGKE